MPHSTASKVPTPDVGTHGINTTELVVVVFFFLLVSVLGFLAARWRKASQANHLEEWGLGGRSFGGWITWFLLGGDLYTAYTFVAVPAALTAGAFGFFAVPYTIIVWPLVFLFLPRLWSVSRKRGYVTPADFARGRYGSKSLGLAVAIVGVVATMPYIALQLVGIQACLDVIGIGGKGSSTFAKDLPLFIAFAVLAAFTYTSGLRAPAVIAFVKDFLIYLVIIVAIIYIPTRIAGGWHGIFHLASTGANGKTKPGFLSLNDHNGKTNAFPYATLALGSAMALFMYPHAQIGVLSTKSRNTVRKNLAGLSLYSLVLGFIALLGYMALAVGFNGTAKGHLGGNAQRAVPALFDAVFPSWFAGVAFAAVAIGALVPAAIMSIAAANLFTRNIFVDFIKPDATPHQQAQVSKTVSLLVKFGALAFVLGLDATSAINFQLLGGVLILQTFPAIVVGLFNRWFHRWALVAGLWTGVIYGVVVAWQQKKFAADGKTVTQHHFGSQIAKVPGTHLFSYIAITALVVNLIVAVVLTLVFRALKVADGIDETQSADYTADEGDADLPNLIEAEPALAEIAESS
ncbi:Na+/solute symporter [Catenulispora acidiphila DSM 44928]|uniref:Na+/solute symporter n=1 Tax=Catenulispora acidiphila (strain DSM 44928 / JCM 14897 / NBRC 102108 / NRRL B-24433 / ID139908) TaxID=479433 RepID=C7Q8L7_CATAD|nr:sodium:solute symporter family protein [Catenulispora acidiphila]ACU70282.1 Na+/solute symporter [Catenulispora acidiphila DSM 44928]